MAACQTYCDWERPSGQPQILSGWRWCDSALLASRRLLGVGLRRLLAPNIPGKDCDGADPLPQHGGEEEGHDGEGLGELAATAKGGNVGMWSLISV